MLMIIGTRVVKTQGVSPVAKAFYIARSLNCRCDSGNLYMILNDTRYFSGSVWLAATRNP
jgi:hypothetical protein